MRLPGRDFLLERLEEKVSYCKPEGLPKECQQSVSLGSRCRRTLSGDLQLLNACTSAWSIAQVIDDSFEEQTK